jgi:ribosome biogenesis GTPase
MTALESACSDHGSEPLRHHLRTLGWSAAWESSFLAQASPPAEPARVLEEHRGGYRLACESGDVPGECAGLLLRPADRHALPAVGDWVVARRLPGEERARIDLVLPRRTRLARRAAGKVPYEQIVAANVDTVLVVCGLDVDFNLGRLERYLVFVAGSGAAAAIVLTKADLCDDLGEALVLTRAIAGSVPVLAVSAPTGRGLDELRELLRGGETVAVVGSSGAGKSTLVNALFGTEVQHTQEVRASDHGGRHTTTARTLLPHPSGWALIDTPGMRELRLVSEESALDGAFSDIAALARQCRFRDCAHVDEPGCAVLAAIGDGSFDPRRLASFGKLERELARQARKARATDQSRIQAAKRRPERRRPTLDDEDDA